MSLTVDWATHKSAKYACEHWHYSQCMPFGKMVRVGAWEDGRFIGVVLFSRGANPQIGMPYGLNQDECVELTRVALRDHECFVSEILAEAIRFLKRKCPGLKLIVSYADVEQNHHGGIYQATNWIYEGKTGGERQFIIHGRKVHPKSLHARYNRMPGFKQNIEWVKANIDPNAILRKTAGKHKYLMPLDKCTRKQIIKLSKPYPERGDTHG